MEPIRYTPSPYIDNDHYHTQTTPHFDDEQVDIELTDLYTYEFILTKPIPVKLEYDAENRIYIMTQDVLNLGGDAATLQGAERELACEIVNLYRTLSSLEVDQLGPYPAELLVYLKQFIS